MISLRRDLGMTKREPLIVVPIIAALALLAAPILLDATGQSRRPAIRVEVYILPNRVLVADLEAVRSGGATACGTRGDPRAAIDWLPQTHAEARNPRNSNEAALVPALEALDATSSSTHSRTYSLSVD